MEHQVLVVVVDSELGTDETQRVIDAVRGMKGVLAVRTMERVVGDAIGDQTPGMVGGKGGMRVQTA